MEKRKATKPLSENRKLVDFKLKYQNQWVAINPESEEVLANNFDLSILKKDLKKIKNPYYLEKVLPISTVFIP